MMDSRKQSHDGVEKTETNPMVVTEFAGTRRTDRKSSPERKLYTTNFGERWRELRVAARDGVFGSGISALRRTPAYI
jgi:hypothetical protein